MSQNPASSPAANQPAPAAAVRQIVIDGIAYGLDELTDTTKRQLTNVRAVDTELAALQRQRAIANVARSAYVSAVSAALPKQATPPQEGGRSAVIDGVAHDWNSLGERVQGLIAGIRAADQELARLNGLAQMANLARSTFAMAVQQNLPKKDPQAAEA